VVLKVHRDLSRFFEFPKHGLQFLRCGYPGGAGFFQRGRLLRRARLEKVWRVAQMGDFVTVRVIPTDPKM
jgi:hypothetical protein